VSGWDVAVVGGGPAGLACAIAARRAGLGVLVLERAPGLHDKACGEGLMPAGLRALERLGVRGALDDGACSAFHGIRYRLEGGASVEARFADGPGLGIRRAALSQALWAEALRLGATRWTGSLRGFTRSEERVLLDTSAGPAEVRLLVGADGLQSLVRRLSGLERAASGPRRFGVRRHFAQRPWSDLVEVHWGEGAECYVTPVGGEVNVAFLWFEASRGAGVVPARPSFDALLERFPAVAAKVAGAPASDEARGAGPFLRSTSARAAGSVALIGDAAGYVDAITGQGLTLALTSAEALVAALVREGGGDARSTLASPARLARALAAYDREQRQPWLRYALPARTLLWLAGHPRLRRPALRLVARSPRLFGALLASVG
jgi:menaquinone-9 beta-reductase